MKAIPVEILITGAKVLGLPTDSHHITRLRRSMEIRLEVVRESGVLREYKARSQRDPNLFYTVISSGGKTICTCPDHKNTCKHQLAVRVVEEDELNQVSRGPDLYTMPFQFRSAFTMQ